MRSQYTFALVLCGLFALGCGKKRDELESSGPPDMTEYTLNVRTPGEGSTLRGSFKVDIAMTLDVRDLDGKPHPKAKSRDMKEEIGYRETIDAFPDGSKRPTKARLTVEKWERPKDAEGITKDGVMPRIVGREIIIEKMNGFYDIRPADNKPLDDNVRLFLDKRYQDYFESFNIHDFLPGKPVRTYSSWDIPVKRLAGSLGSMAPLPFDKEKSKGSGKLTRVWDKDGRKYGRIELSTELVIKSEKDVTFKDGKIELSWVLELCIDGSKHDVTATATMNMSFEVTHSKEGSGKVAAKGTVTVTETEEKVGKAAKPAPPRKDDPKGDRDDLVTPIDEEMKKEGVAPKNLDLPTRPPEKEFPDKQFDPPTKKEPFGKDFDDPRFDPPRKKSPSDAPPPKAPAPAPK